MTPGDCTPRSEEGIPTMPRVNRRLFPGGMTIPLAASIRLPWDLLQMLPDRVLWPWGMALTHQGVIVLPLGRWLPRRELVLLLSDGV